MEDKQIIELYWQRSEQAIRQSERKYGSYCRRIALNILNCREDSEECVSDTWLRSWETMPPQRPNRLSAFFGRITRNLALNRLDRRNAQKRGGGQVELALEELMECVPSPNDTAKIIDELALTEVLNRFLGGLSPEARRIFLRRYWYLCPIRDIAQRDHISQSKVKMTLLRCREQLRRMLEEEGFTL